MKALPVVPPLRPARAGTIDPRGRAAALARWAAIAALVVCGLAFTYVCLRQLTYPGFLEYMEGNALAQIERVASGLPLYAPPDAEYIALPYMPLYSFLAAPLYLVFGDSFIGPRVISVMAALLCGILVTLIGWRESGSVTVAALAGGLYFAAYRIMDAYVTSALPDALLLFWVLLGFYWWAYGSTRRHDLLWLVCFLLAFWTKQQGALYMGVALVYALIWRRNALPRWLLVAGVALGGPIAYVVAARLLGERFVFYTLTLPGRWDYELWFGVRRTAFVLACLVPLGLSLSLCDLRSRIRRSGWLRPTPLAWFLLASLAAATVTTGAAGGSNNHYIPFLALLCVSAACGAAALAREGAPKGFGWWLAGMAALSVAVTWVATRDYAQHPIPAFVQYVALAAWVAYVVGRALPRQRPGLAPALAVALVAGQFAASHYDLRQALPPAGLAAALKDLRSELAAVEGTVVWLPYGNTPAALTGGKIARVPSTVSLEDIARQVGSQGEADRDLAAFRERIRAEPGLHLLSATPLEEMPVWEELAEEFAVVEDYGNRFAPIRQIAYHWYSGGEYPRWLYGRTSEAAH